MITEEQHQEWKKDLEELHSVKAENEELKTRNANQIKKIEEQAEEIGHE